jgi:uncharacterized protein involved in copper resistance
MKFKTLTLSAATAALLATGAFAQDNPATKTQPEVTPPAATEPVMPGKDAAPDSMTKAPAAKPAMPSDSTASKDMPATKSVKTTTESLSFTSTASTDQMAVSKLMGTPVRNSADENLGDINDVLVDNSGKPAVAIIGVGGFLGIGEKNVGVPFESLEFVTANKKRVARLDITKQALQSAPTFVYQEEKTATEQAPVKTN